MRICSVRSHPVLLVSCHLLSKGDTSQEVRRLPLLLEAAEHSNKGLLGHAAAMVLGGGVGGGVGGDCCGAGAAVSGTCFAAAHLPAV